MRLPKTALLLGLTVMAPSACVFSQDPARAGGAAPARNGEPFGYTAAFDAALRRIGPISPEQFARRFPSGARYLDRLSWGPTTSKFFKDFNQSPPPRGKHGGTYDFHLDAAERALFKKNGFVVSARMGADNFAEMFYRIYSRDLPVYVSADAVLHAWHRSYDAMLEELEETYLVPALGGLLAGMAGALPAARQAYGKGVLADGLADADYFLAVADSLLAGRAVKTRLAQDERVAATLKACDDLALQDFDLFGRDRRVDFSQFKPRGHYERSEQLRRYFRAMMWCGRIDLRVAGDSKSSDEAAPRELAAAVVLHDLLRRSGRFGQWRRFDRLLQAFVGRTDSMTFAQLGAVLERAGIRSAADVKGPETLERLRADIVAGRLGVQHVVGDVFVSPLGPGKASLPRSFTVLGQRFALDSWAMGKLVYDDVVWQGEKVMRRVPSALDVAFAVLGNDQVVPELVGRMTARDGRRFRDGLDYQHNLAAARRVVDAQGPAAWEDSLYAGWLACLRELSRPTTDATYPEAMRTRAWAMRTLNTQLASWAQLRHDSILYTKQSYTRESECDYPAGFVEPLPGFWSRLEKMARGAAELIEKTTPPDPDRARRAHFFRNFAGRVAVLKEIAVKELARKELTGEETRFLRQVVEDLRGDDGKSGGPFYKGWYFELFYRGPEDGTTRDALVADVHTDPPDPLADDPGCVLHQGVGNVDLLMVAVDSGKDRMAYAGPVLSHYEFEMPGVQRKADSEWREDIQKGKLPPRPPWTRTYLAPGENKDGR